MITAYCAPGKARQAEELLKSQNVEYDELLEHPWFFGSDSVMVADEGAMFAGGKFGRMTREEFDRVARPLPFPGDLAGSWPR